MKTNHHKSGSSRLANEVDFSATCAAVNERALEHLPQVLEVLLSLVFRPTLISDLCADLFEDEHGGASRGCPGGTRTWVIVGRAGPRVGRRHPVLAGGD